VFRRFFRNRFVSKILETDDPPRRIARGVAAGTFIAVSPTIGFQILLAILSAIVIRGNRLAAVAMTFVLNPFIFIPPSYWYFPSYYLGAFLLRMEPVGISKITNVYKSAGSISELLGNLWSLGIEIYGPLFFGSTVIGIPLALLMYYISSRIVLRDRSERGESNSDATDKTNGGDIGTHSNGGSDSGVVMPCTAAGTGKNN
jgi:uncharacterized protein (DUF2062 family)